MSESIHVVVLDGLAPRPLASYLAALGLMRVVGEGLDRDVRGCWESDRFVLRTSASPTEIEAFLLNEYAPSPIVAPWNGGSGFGPKDPRQGFDPIRTSSTPRLATYRATIDAAVAARRRFALAVDVGDGNQRDKVEAAEKEALVRRCRATFPDAALAFLDAALALTSDGLRFPPLLGTGGNDGRLDFSRNFMERIVELIDPATGEASASSARLLAAALWSETVHGLNKGAAIGQFAPGDAGGYNQTTGIAKADAVVNPWGYVLMMEGTCLFAGGATRRMSRNSGPSASSFPFTVAAATGVATLAGSEAGSARGEVWLPIWSRPAGLRELQAVFAEGRARVGGRPAHDGVDFARAVTTLGVDRGISAFERLGIHERNGRNFFAVPLDRIEVGASEAVRLIDAIDAWLDRFAGLAASGSPASLGRARRTLEDAVFRVCRQVDQERPQAADVQALLVALADAEAALVRSTSRDPSARKGLRPLPTLDRRWLRLAQDDSPEWRLALALASLSLALDDGGRCKPLRYFLVPTAPTTGKTVAWRDAGDGAERDLRALVGATAPKAALHNLLLRLLRAADQVAPGAWPVRATRFGRLTDVERLLSGGLDLERLWDLTRALAYVDLASHDDYEPADPNRPAGRREPTPAADFAALRLTMLSPAEAAAVALEGSNGHQHSVIAASGMLDRRVVRLLTSGRSAHAVEAARCRLRGRGFSMPPLLPAQSSTRATRLALAMLVPLGPRALTALKNQLQGTDPVQDREADSTGV